MELDIRTLKVLKAAGVYFGVHIPQPGGGTNSSLDVDEICEFVEDKIAFAAKREKVSRADYVLWLETDGTPQCGATTTSGKRCKNLVSGGVQFSIHDWLDLDGGLCAVHGGQSSEDAKTERWGRK